MLIELETNYLGMAPSVIEAWPAFERFYNDMQKETSGFFSLPGHSSWKNELKEKRTELQELIASSTTFLHLGIGGSSLGAEVIVKALKPQKARDFYFLDNIDPDFLKDVLDASDPAKTLLYVVTKSGTTLETIAQFLYIYQWMEKKLGAKAARKRLVFCTDPIDGDLRKLSKEWGITTFDIPPNLGGRYSALSAVGLFPAYFSGINCDLLLEGAADVQGSIINAYSKKTPPPVALLAQQLVQHYEKKNRNITVLMPYSQLLKSTSAWLVQLWAESLGKDGKGLTPVPALGATDQHSILQLLRDGPDDKVVGFLQIEKFQHSLNLKWSGPDYPAFKNVDGITLNKLMEAEFEATREVLTKAKKPHFTMRLETLDAKSLGGLIFFFETLTALAGYYLGINPFDQPGVEEGKKLTLRRIRS